MQILAALSWKGVTSLPHDSHAVHLNPVTTKIGLKEIIFFTRECLWFRHFNEVRRSQEEAYTRTSPLLCKPTLTSRLPVSSPNSSSFPRTSCWFALHAGFGGPSLRSLSFSSLLFVFRLTTSLPPLSPCDLELAEGNHSEPAVCDCVCEYIFIFSIVTQIIKAVCEKKKKSVTVVKWQLWSDSLLEGLTCAAFGVKPAENMQQRETRLPVIKGSGWPLRLHTAALHACQSAFGRMCQHVLQLGKQLRNTYPTAPVATSRIPLPWQPVIKRLHLQQFLLHGIRASSARVAGEGGGERGDGMDTVFFNKHTIQLMLLVGERNCCPIGRSHLHQPHPLLP